VSPGGLRRSKVPASLDLTDRRLIERLQDDGRVPFAEIARAIGVDEAEIQARAERLREAGVIDVVAVTDPLRLGYPRQAMLGVVVEGPSAPVGDLLAEIEEVIYLARTTGGFDLFAEVVGTSDVHLLELVTRIRRLPGVTRIHTFLYQELVKETYTYGTGWGPADPPVDPATD
jgi:Lrp/AsnC family transcriptional regulator for asnA, asnC and gidA